MKRVMKKSTAAGSRQSSAPARRHKKVSSNVIYYAILAALLGVLIFSCVKIITYFKKDKEQTAINDHIIDEYVSSDNQSGGEGGEDDPIPGVVDPQGGEIQTQTPSSEPVTIDPQPDMISVDFGALCSKYPDVVGYIYCANTRNTKGQYGINYPIVYSAETADYKGVTEEKYLHHAIDGSENANGAIFMEELCSPSFSSQNTIIYGHNMKTGAMFQPLEYYKNQYYYDAHPYMYIYTPNQNYRIDLFAGCVVEHDADIYATSVSQETLQKYAQNSTFKSKTGVPSGKIVTLSTCSYEINNGRYVVLGELVPIS